MKSQSHRTCFRLVGMDTRATAALLLQRTKLLLGSDPRCDVVLTDRGISPQHCYLMITAEGLRVIDLASTNGVFVNGRRLNSGDVFPGDTLTVADLAFRLEAVVGADSLLDCEAEVPLLARDPALVQVPERSGLTLVDQDYCDLSITPSESDLVSTPTYALQNQVEFEELDSIEQPLDLLATTDSQRLEVVIYSSGQVVDVHFVELNAAGLTLSATPAAGRIWFPGLSEDINILESVAGGWRLRPASGFSYDRNDLVPGEGPVFLTKGCQQLSLRLVEQSLRLRPLPWLWRDRGFYQQSLKVTAGLMAPFLLLLFIQVPEMKPPEIKQLAVIYKVAKPRPTEAKVNVGVTQQASAKPHSVAARAAGPAPAPAVVKAQAYKFSSSVSLDAVVLDTDGEVTASSGRTPATTKSGVQASSLALGSSSPGGGGGVGVGKLGYDATGVAAHSVGAKGLVNKKSFDHTYLAPKTVVLGSIDPELLRKILQEYLPQFRHCYQQELMAATKDLKGVVELDFQIASDGRVGRTDIKPQDTRFSQKATNCMAGVLRIIEFPKPKGGGVVDVRQPLNFFAETEKI